MPMFERRKIERFQLTIPVRLVTTSSDRKKEVLELQTNNISARGAFLKTDHLLPEGTSVQVDFVLSVAKFTKPVGVFGFVKVRGSILRSGSGGIAVCFNNDYEILPFRNV
jgi:hypothetical protein